MSPYCIHRLAMLSSWGRLMYTAMNGRIFGCRSCDQTDVSRMNNCCTSIEGRVQNMEHEPAEPVPYFHTYVPSIFSVQLYGSCKFLKPLSRGKHPHNLHDQQDEEIPAGDILLLAIYTMLVAAHTVQRDSAIAWVNDGTSWWKSHPYPFHPEYF